MTEETCPHCGMDQPVAGDEFLSHFFPDGSGYCLGSGGIVPLDLGRDDPDTWVTAENLATARAQFEDIE